MLMGLDHVPAFTIISRLWHNIRDATSNALFIADAWVDFSYVGAIVFSIIAGALCRLIDAIYLVKGKTLFGIAVMAAAFAGVFALLISVLNTAFCRADCSSHRSW
jgi:predicted membrane-bound spermidine synthase